MKDVYDLVNAYKKNKTWIAGQDFVPYAGPYFDEKEQIAAIECILDGWLVMGKKSMAFERNFPKQFGKTHGILTNSGSSSNLLMMSALTSKTFGWPKGTKVLMPIAGFPTTLNPTLQVGFEPVFVDIEIDTLNLDIDKVEQVLRKNKDIKIITFAHVLGNCPDMDRLMDLVDQYRLILLEDCCDALGSTYNDKPLGSFGTMASCSFYPAHHMTMGEGGFVACSDPVTEDVLRSFREWGRGCYCVGPEANKLKCGTCKKRFSNWIPSMPDEIFDHKYVYNEIGYNLKPIELQAAMGLEQIKKLPEIHALRRRNYSLLMKIYEKYEEFFHLPRATEGANPSWFAFPLTIRKGAPFTRTQIVDFLENHYIQTRPYFAGNIMLQPAYSHLMNQNEARDNFPVATHTMTHSFFHGTSPVITEEQITYIGECVDKFLSQFI
jgi:CDP-6-deoxy-D-xylo-4-hexulose-3-dehydrase